MCIPGPETVKFLLKSAKTSPRVRAHQRRVTETALKIGWLAAPFAPVRLDLLEAAASLHDIGKTCSTQKENHAERGAAFLRESGFPEVAREVAQHTDLSENPSFEAEILYLADKYVNGVRLLPLEERAARMRAKFADDSEALEASMRRMEKAREIERRIERLTGVFPLLPRLFPTDKKRRLNVVSVTGEANQGEADIRAQGGRVRTGR